MVILRSTLSTWQSAVKSQRSIVSGLRSTLSNQQWTLSAIRRQSGQKSGVRSLRSYELGVRTYVGTWDWRIRTRQVWPEVVGRVQRSVSWRHRPCTSIHSPPSRSSVSGVSVGSSASPSNRNLQTQRTGCAVKVAAQPVGSVARLRNCWFSRKTLNTHKVQYL